MSIKCIYCRHFKERVDFNVEHVIPASFGKFKRNLTLVNAVCSCCNQYFGDNLDIVLARDSLEGLMRHTHGVQEVKTFKKLGGRRVQINTSRGAYAGQSADLVADRDRQRLVLQVQPQVGFTLSDGSGYKFFGLDELPTREQLSSGTYDLSQPRSIVFNSAVRALDAEAALRERGIKFVKQGEYIDFQEGDAVDCNLSGCVDQDVMRGVSKIAFNYLAYTQGMDFVLDDNFNSIRAYVRHGVEAPYPLVEIKESSVFADEPAQGFRRLGHIITVNWASDGSSIVAQVSLMNFLRYSVCLCRDFIGEKRDIKTGHFFNVAGKCVNRLSSVVSQR